MVNTKAPPIISSHHLHLNPVRLSRSARRASITPLISPLKIDSILLIVLSLVLVKVPAFKPDLCIFFFSQLLPRYQRVQVRFFYIPACTSVREPVPALTHDVVRQGGVFSLAHSFYCVPVTRRLYSADSGD